MLEKDISFQLKNLEIVESALNPPNPNLSNNKPEAIQFSVYIEHRFNIEKKLVIVVIFIKLLEDQYELGSIKTSSIFEIQDFDKFITEKNVPELPTQAIINLNNIAISTTRGILFAYFRGTRLQNAILPIINPTDFKKVQQDE